MVTAIHLFFTVHFFILVWIDHSACQPAIVALGRDQIAVRESENSREICVVVTTGEIAVKSTLTISTHGLSATVEEDFVGIFEEELTFFPGDMSRCTNFTVVEDNVVEGDEHLTIQIQSSMLLIGTPRTADITIVDTSRITIGLVSAVFTVTEGMQMQASVCAAIRNGTIARAVDFSIEALAVGTASYDPDEADYIPSTVSLTFDLHTHNLNVCGNFVIVDDNLPPTVAEDDEYFLVSLSTSDNADVIPEETTAKVVIHDNDGVSVRLAESSLSFTEGEPGELTLAIVCVLLTDIHDGLERDVNFSLSIIHLNSATEDDFGPQDTITITFSSGSLMNDNQCTDYLIIGDDLKEGPEKFSILLSAVDSIDTVVGNQSVCITIEDDRDVIQDCGPPAGIENGYLDYDLTLNGSVATYSCNEGYILTGEDSVTCLTNVTMILGEWSGGPPVCNVIDCGVPPTGGANSQVQYSVTTFGASATYSCTRECFELDSDEDTLTCLSNESWSGDPPRCHLIECGQPEEVEGCQLSPITSTNCGSIAIYSALAGFTVDGDKNISCRNNGEWRGDMGFTLCQSITCPMLEDPANGTTNSNSTQPQPHGTVMEVSCMNGFRIEGNASRTCLSDGTWSGEEPICVFVECDLVTPENGNAARNGTGLGSIIQYSCNLGYELVGHAQQECLENGIWSEGQVRCEFVECELVTPENGNAARNGTGLGSIIQYSCNLGYELVGHAQQECLENGIWSEGQVRCELIDCNEPITENFTGNVTYDNTTYSNLAIFTCPGNCSQNTSVCNKNGNWTETYLDCFRCEKLQSPDNGVVIVKGDFSPGSIAAYECDEGYVLSAKNNMRDCTCEGWNGRDPTCEKNEDQENNIILIIVVVTVGGSAVLMALIVCVVLVWCCVVKTSPKANHLKQSRKNNYKGNVSYVLPYTIYANRSSALEPLDSQNRHSDLFDIPSSLDSDRISPFNDTYRGAIVFQSVRGSKFGNQEPSGRLITSARGSYFGGFSPILPVKRRDSAGSSTLTSIPEGDVPAWDNWAESSFSSSETSDQNFIDDSTSVLTTTTTTPTSEHRHSPGTTAIQSQTKKPVSILKKK